VFDADPDDDAMVEDDVSSPSLLSLVSAEDVFEDLAVPEEWLSLFEF